jgi:hypothetical protein
MRGFGVLKRLIVIVASCPSVTILRCSLSVLCSNQAVLAYGTPGLGGALLRRRRSKASA